MVREVDQEEKIAVLVYFILNAGGGLDFNGLLEYLLRALNTPSHFLTDVASQLVLLSQDGVAFLGSQVLA